MSEQKRFLLTFDSSQGVPVKVEQVGEAGELTEVELSDLFPLLKALPAPPAAPQQITINIYGGAGAHSPAGPPSAPPKPPVQVHWDEIPRTTLSRKPKKE